MARNCEGDCRCCSLLFGTKVSPWLPPTSFMGGRELFISCRCLSCISSNFIPLILGLISTPKLYANLWWLSNLCHLKEWAKLYFFLPQPPCLSPSLPAIALNNGVEEDLEPYWLNPSIYTIQEPVASEPVVWVWNERWLKTQTVSKDAALKKSTGLLMKFSICFSINRKQKHAKSSETSHKLDCILFSSRVFICMALSTTDSYFSSSSSSKRLRGKSMCCLILAFHITDCCLLVR